MNDLQRAVVCSQDVLRVQRKTPAPCCRTEPDGNAEIKVPR